MNDSDSDDQNTDYVRQIEDLQEEINTMLRSHSVELTTHEDNILDFDPQTLVSGDEDDGGTNPRLSSLQTELVSLLQKIKTAIEQQSVSQDVSRSTRRTFGDDLALYNSVFQPLGEEEINRLAINEYYLLQIEREIYSILSEIKEIGRNLRDRGERVEEFEYSIDHMKLIPARQFHVMISSALSYGNSSFTDRIKGHLVTISNLHEQFMSALNNIRSIERQPEKL